MADEERTVDQLSSDELFKGATALPPEPETPPVEPPVVVAEPPAVASVVVPPPVVPPAPAVEPPEAAIPSWRLREEAEGRRVAEDRARALEIRLNEIATHLRQQQKPPDFFEGPEQATMALINRTFQPYAEETRKTMMYLGKMVAEARHGEDKVAEAEKVFLEARDRNTLDPADYERVVQSPNRFDAVVRWHRKQSVLASVGDDPAAWFDKQLEARMADPQFQAKLLEKVQKDAATRPSITKLPPSLSKSTAAASNSGGGEISDLSDQSLFAHAIKGLR